MAWRSVCAIALAVSAGVCSAGRTGTVATGFGLTPAAGGAVCAAAGNAALAMTRLAAIADLMTILQVEARVLNHTCLIATNRIRVKRRCSQRTNSNATPAIS